MFTHTTRWWRSSLPQVRLLALAGLLLLSLFPVYRNYHYGYGQEQIKRHKEFLEGRSMFFNPWQYRVLCPLVSEGIYRTGNFIVGDQLKARLTARGLDPERLIYLASFLGFRVLLHLAIFVLAFELYSAWVANARLILFGFSWLAYSMGNSIRESDLSLNTYMDVAVYLTGLLIWTRSSSVWPLVPLIAVGALNRETSLLLPLIFLFRIDSSAVRFEPARVVPVVVSLLTFAAVFFSIRLHYGYREPAIWQVPAGLSMLQLNLFSAQSRFSYMEMLGTVGILPFVALLGWRKLPSELRFLLLMVPPIWFGVHFWKAVAWESRLFLVPVVCVFLPATLFAVSTGLRCDRKEAIDSDARNPRDAESS
jgi:hypothetical protein